MFSSAMAERKNSCWVLIGLFNNFALGAFELANVGQCYRLTPPSNTTTLDP